MPRVGCLFGTLAMRVPGLRSPLHVLLGWVSSRLVAMLTMPPVPVHAAVQQDHDDQEEPVHNPRTVGLPELCHERFHLRAERTTTTECDG